MLQTTCNIPLEHLTCCQKNIYFLLNCFKLVITMMVLNTNNYCLTFVRPLCFVRYSLIAFARFFALVRRVFFGAAEVVCCSGRGERYRQRGTPHRSTYIRLVNTPVADVFRRRPAAAVEKESVKTISFSSDDTAVAVGLQYNV